MKKYTIFLSIFSVVVMNASDGSSDSIKALDATEKSVSKTELKDLVIESQVDGDYDQGNLCGNYALGPYLRNLRYENIPIVRGFDERNNIYVLNVFNQVTDNTCGRHTIKNLIYFINATEQKSLERLKNALMPLYSGEVFHRLNRELSRYFQIDNMYDDITFPHKAFNVFLNFERFIKEYNLESFFLEISGKYHFDFNIGNVTSKICPIPMSLDQANGALIKEFTDNLFGKNGNQFLYAIEKDESKHFNTKEFYKKYIPHKGFNWFYFWNSSLSKHIVPFDIFKKVIANFKASEQKVLGLMVLLPEAPLGHWIGVVIRKINCKAFEIFVLDSGHSPFYKLKDTFDTLAKGLNRARFTKKEF